MIEYECKASIIGLLANLLGVKHELFIMVRSLTESNSALYDPLSRWTNVSG